MRTTSDGNGRYRNRCSSRKKPGVDRLSNLPDSVLLHILSFLPIEDAIGTEVLSKRWKSLWTYSLSLVFRQYIYDDDPDDEKRISYDIDIEEWINLEDRNFDAFVDKTLLLSNCSKVDKLEFDFEYKPCLASKADLWTRFAAVKGTEELYLVFHDENYYADKNRRYELPQHLFTNSFFRELNFRNCRVNPKGNIGWKSLKKLSIGELRLSYELLEKILSSSPVLEMLELFRYQGFGRLHVNNASLKKLILISYVGPAPTYEEDEAEAEHDNEEAEAQHDSGEDEDEADGAHGAEEDAADGGNALEEDLADGENPAEEDEADDGHGFEEDEGGGEQDPEGLEISAPHLQSLETSGCLAWNCQLRNVSSLVDAKLACNLKSDGGEEDFIRIQNELGGLLSSFAHVKSLAVEGLNFVGKRGWADHH
ncbi:hypothetical protein RHSIM_Rhsim13G0170900 [Rhododendron simsii]|uniref:F-box domain-containing protein n=1 Tax=Rhododendron simsii TaxID=118357 RepID=A0A834L3C0_RHOSS|nr:hypothetical protein RHSIM_Rhsim13G0170900 [Rhododendron simsii]